MRLKLKAFRKFYVPCLPQDAEDGAVSSSDVASSNVVSAKPEVQGDVCDCALSVDFEGSCVSPRVPSTPLVM